jgi:ribonuclease Y
MLVDMLVPIITLLLGVAIGLFIMKMYGKNKFKEYELEAKAKAEIIKEEANAILADAKAKSKELEMKAKQLEALAKDKENNIDRTIRLISEKENRLNELINKKKQQLQVLTNELSNIAHLTKEEARELLFKRYEEEIQSDLAKRHRKLITQAKERVDKEANYMLAMAVTKYAGEFAGERLINTIQLPSDEHKGRIIGKEGRNIKTLEQLLGVDIIIDDTPGVILVSNFNLYRRSIATTVIERLIEDGRIHPGRIEEIHQKVQAEFEQKIYEEGEKVVIDLGLYPMHEELIKLIGKLKYRASYGQNTLAHSLEVARLAKSLAAEMGGDEKIALRAGLLHDIGKALTQDYGGSHVELGAEVCRKYNENQVVINAIYAHHGHEDPICVESAAVCAADALSAARPGARREVLESFTKRVKELEKIALSFDGVMQAYAINAGREIRVFIDSDKISDEELPLLTHKIAKEIEKKLQYPGEIKVHAIRQILAVDFAK